MGKRETHSLGRDMPDTYAESHITNTSTTPGAAAHRAAQKKTDKYANMSSPDVFYPFAVETAGAWHEMAIELTQEIGRHVTTVTEDTRETTFLFQLSTSVHGSPTGECGLLPEYNDHRVKCRCFYNTLSINILYLRELNTEGQKYY